MSKDDSIKIWDIEGNLKRQINGFVENLRLQHITNDNNYLIQCTNDSNIQLIDLE